MHPIAGSASDPAASLHSASIHAAPASGREKRSIRPTEMQRRLPNWFAAEARTPEPALEDAQRLVAHAFGLETWEELTASLTAPVEDPRSAPVFIARTPPFYTIDWSEDRLQVRGSRSEKDWDRIFAVMREHGITRLTAGGLHDGAMKRLARLDHVIDLRIEGGPALTDADVAHLAGMPRPEELTLGGPKSPITGRGLAFLRHLPALRRFQCCWAQGCRTTAWRPSRVL